MQLVVGGSTSRGGSSAGSPTRSTAGGGSPLSESDGETCEVCGSGRSHPGNDILLCDGKGRDGKGGRGNRGGGKKGGGGGGSGGNGKPEVFALTPLGARLFGFEQWE